MEEPLSAKSTGTMLLLQCGLRRGETLGLTWGDINLGERTLSVSKQFTNDKTLRAPKSKMSRRTIAINESLTQYLDEWKREQQAQLDRYGLDQDSKTPVVSGINAARATPRVAGVPPISGTHRPQGRSLRSDPLGLRVGGGRQVASPPDSRRRTKAARTPSSQARP